MRAGTAALGVGAAAGLMLSATAAGLVGFTAWTALGVERALPPEGRLIEVEGARVHVLEAGSGPDLLLIHGLGGQMRNFTYALVDQLRDRFHVVVMERPGSGYSTRAPGASARLGVQAEAVAGVIGALGLDRPLLVGHSLGGALALAVAVQHPTVTRGLALVSPLTRPQETVSDAFKGLLIPSPLLRRIVAWTLATPLALANSRRILATVFGPETPPDDWPLRGGGALGLRPRAFLATSTDLMAVNEDLGRFHARYGELDLPVGVLFGTGDRILDPELQGASLPATVKGATYQALPGGGHMIPLTRPAEVSAFIGDVHART